jgi:WD40 repeat protein
MNDMPEIRHRRFVAIATAEYAEDSSITPLPGVVDEVNEIRGWLTNEQLDDRRFEPDPKELAVNPSDDQIRATFMRPRTRVDWGPADAAVVYITGHGETWHDPPDDFGQQAARHFLILQDTIRKELTSSGFPTAELFDGLKNLEIEHLLVIVDACFAGQVLDQVNTLARDRWLILPSATKQQRARLGALTRAITRFVHQGAAYNRHSRYLPVRVFVQAVNDALPQGQRVKHIYKGDGSPEKDRDEHICLPNPHYNPNNELVETTAARQDLALRKASLTLHNRVAGRLPTPDAPGWLFTCRATLMEELLAAAGTPGATMVTGSVGSGKSTALARLVTLSDPQFREEYAAELAGIPEQLMPPEAAVHVAVSARKKPNLEIVSLLCHYLLGSLPQAPGESPVEAGRDALIGFLANRRQPVTIVVDALDEAETPAELVQDVLAPLIQEDTGQLCLLVGVRSPAGDGAGAGQRTVNGKPLPDLVAEELGARPIPVDRGPWWSQQDLDTFVRNILVNTERSPGSPASSAPTGRASPYRDAEAPFLTAVVDAINGMARSSYLIAEVAAGSLADRDDIIALDDPDWRAALQGGLVGVLREDLQASISSPEARRRDVVLLRAVAFARSIGLPWSEVWPRVANAVDVGASTASTYGDDAVESLLGSRLSAYLVTDQEDDLTVYRMMHNELRQILRYQWQELLSEEPVTPASEAEIAAVERRIAGQLQPAIEPTLALDQPPAPYVRRHLAEHALVGGVLEERIPVPFLPYLDLSRLRALVTAAPARRELERTVSWLPVLWQIAHLWDWDRPGHNAAAIEMWAALNGVALQGAAKEPGPVGGPWRVLWAVRPPDASNVLGHQEDIGRAAAMADLANVPIAVTGTENGKLYTWDLTTGRRYRDREPIDTQSGPVRAVTAAQLPDGQVLAVTGGTDGTVRIWDLGSSRALGNLSGLGGGPIQAVTAATLPDGRVVIAAADESGMVQAWDLAGRERVGDPVDCGPGLALGLEIAVVGQQVLGLATGWDNGLQLWDLMTGRPVRDRLTGHPLARQPRTGTAADGRAIATVVLDQRDVAIIGNGSGLLLCDLRNQDWIERRLEGSVREIRSLAVVRQSDGQTLGIVGGSGGVQIWDLTAGEPVGDPLAGHTDAVEAVAFLKSPDGTPVAISTGRDKSVRSWEMTAAALSAARPWAQDLRAVEAVATARPSPQGPAIAISCSRAVVQVWDLEHGGDPVLLTGYGSPLVSVAAAELPDGTLVLAGHLDGRISTWSLADPGRSGCQPIGDWNTAAVLATAELTDGRIVVLAGGWDGLVRVWDPRGGAAAGPVIAGDAGIAAIAVASVGGRSLCVAGTVHGHVCIRDLDVHLDPRLPVVRPAVDTRLNGKVASLTTAVLTDGRACAVVGAEDGTVHVLDLVDGGVIGRSWSACTGEVTAVAAGPLDGVRTAVFTGGAEALIRAWDANTGQPIGEALPAPGPVRSLVFEPDSGCLVIGGTGIAVARPRFGHT